MVGTNDLDSAAVFREAIFAPFCLMQVERKKCASYAPSLAKEATEFYVTLPFASTPAMPQVGLSLTVPGNHHPD